MLEKSKENIKKAKENFNAPTPPFWHKLGYALMTVGSLSASVSAFMLPPWITASLSILGAAGKIITKFAIY